MIGVVGFFFVCLFLFKIGATSLVMGSSWGPGVPVTHSVSLP